MSGYALRFKLKRTLIGIAALSLLAPAASHADVTKGRWIFDGFARSTQDGRGSTCVSSGGDSHAFDATNCNQAADAAAVDRGAENVVKKAAADTAAAKRAAEMKRAQENLRGGQKDAVVKRTDGYRLLDGFGRDCVRNGSGAVVSGNCPADTAAADKAAPAPAADTSAAARARAIAAEEIAPGALLGPDSKGAYVYRPEGANIRDGYGRTCVKDGRWSPGLATEECEPELFNDWRAKNQAAKEPELAKRVEMPPPEVKRETAAANGPALPDAGPGVAPPAEKSAGDKPVIDNTIPAFPITTYAPDLSDTEVAETALAEDDADETPIEAAEEDTGADDDADTPVASADDGDEGIPDAAPMAMAEDEEEEETAALDTGEEDDGDGEAAALASGDMLRDDEMLAMTEDDDDDDDLAAADDDDDDDEAVAAADEADDEIPDGPAMAALDDDDDDLAAADDDDEDEAVAATDEADDEIPDGPAMAALDDDDDDLAAADDDDDDDDVVAMEEADDGDIPEGAAVAGLDDDDGDDLASDDDDDDDDAVAMADDASEAEDLSAPALAAVEDEPEEEVALADDDEDEPAPAAEEPAPVVAATDANGPALPDSGPGVAPAPERLAAAGGTTDNTLPEFPVTVYSYEAPEEEAAPALADDEPEPQIADDGDDPQFAEEEVVVADAGIPDAPAMATPAEPPIEVAQAETPKPVEASAPTPAPEPAPAPSADAECPPTTIQVEGGRFEFNRWNLRPEITGTLDTIAERLNSVKCDAILIVGHTDRIGTSKYNQKLSERRANAARDYLVTKHKIDPTRILVGGKGKTEPVTQLAQCKGKRKKALIKCYAPDRRVVITASTRK